MTNNRTVVIEGTVADGKIPVYNASQDNFQAGTPSSVAAVIDGPGVSFGPTATGTQSLVGGYIAFDNAKAHSIALGIKAAAKADAELAIGTWPGSMPTDPATGDVIIGYNAGGSGYSGAGPGSGDSVGIGESCVPWDLNSIAIGNSTSNHDDDCICIGNGVITGSSKNDGSTSCIAIGTNISGTSGFHDIINLGPHSDVRSNYGIVISGTSNRTEIAGELKLGPSTYDINIAGVSGPQIVFPISMVTFCGITTGSGAGESKTLALADLTTQIPLRPHFTTLAGLLCIEAQAQGVVTGTSVTKAFFQNYICDANGNFVVADPSNFAVTTGAGASSWTLTLAIDGSSNLTLVFNTGSTTTVATIVANVRYQLMKA
jgi:hypothetical protein